ncbi:MAG: chromosome segregation protein SMC [Bacteroidota bacterium]
MYLSNLEIIGFKSFAQRVNLKFDSGVTAIVGPNGCGKTNIVDAIRWSLGEQRYSTLRSDKMEDVIFNGTKNRKPLGLAEVSLTIQNTKGILPTEYTEVTLTRRVYRSGESEYLLNKVPCRLKDILDLFMDTGMGADAYSVIELKMVETILSDKTDERRKLFEEAAGVTKYKHRRKAAYRKLESVQQDLVRVNDIVKEVQKTVGSLERQAKKAEQYNDVSNRLKALEIDLLEREFAYLHGKLQPIEEKYRLATMDKQKIDEELLQREIQLDSLREELRTIESALIEAQKTLAQHREELHKHEEKILVANERVNSLRSNIERYEKEKLDLRERKDKLDQERTTLASQKEKLSGEIEKLRNEYNESKKNLQSAGEAFEGKKSQVQSLNESLLQLAHVIVQKRGEYDRLRTKIDNQQGRISHTMEEITLYGSDIERCTRQVEELTEKDRELRRRFVEQEMVLLEKDNKKKAFRQEMDDLGKTIVQMKHGIEQRTQKIEFIRSLIESDENYTDGTKYILGSETGKRKAFITIADAIQTPENYRTAIETALGDAAFYIIVDKLADIQQAVEELNTHDKGKATFVCLEKISHIRHFRKNGNKVVWASDVITCKDAYKPLMRLLFQNVAIVDTIEQGRELLSAELGMTCVTPDGQVVRGSGMVRGGSKHLKEGGRIGNKALIEGIEREIKTLEQKLEQDQLRLKQVNAMHDGIDLVPLRQMVREIEKNMTAVEMQIAQVEFEKKRANDALQRNTLEKETLEHEVIDLKSKFDAMNKELGVVDQRKSLMDQQLTTATAELETLENDFNEISKISGELEIASLKSEGDFQNIEKDLERNDLSAKDTDVTLSRRDEEVARASEEIFSLSDEIERFTGEANAKRIDVQTYTEKQKEIDSTHSAKRNELHTIELKIKDERRLHDDSLNTAHDLAMKITELKSNIDHLKERATEEFEFDLKLKTYPDDEFVDFAHLRDEVKNLKERIRVLGAINFAAFDEFKTEGERLTFLTQQRDDLIEAEKSLISAIEEINATAQKIFLETFAKIRENFIKIFKELFMEGDLCDLKLQEEVDPLEAGIEILAQPRGKRPTSIDLLSGGEKTLTAIALLFAIYLVKPSPFCILDEVDAPLDDSNIDRYTRILQKFSDNTQFIVVTHNKRTMEAAQALYGVTMEEEGISKLVTVRFNEESKVKSATLSSGV